MKQKILPILQLLTLSMVIMLSSCNIWEDNSKCAMHIAFKYDYNMAYKDLRPNQCDKIELFIYNEEGKLVQRILEEGDVLKKNEYKMPVRLSGGTYTFMAWAGHKESYTLDNIEMGASIQDMLLNLNHIDHNSKKQLEPMWNGSPISFTFESAVGQTRTIDLRKNTNRLNINLHNSDKKFNATDMIVEVKGANGSYKFDNSLTNKTPIIYSPFFIENIGDNEATFSVDFLRLIEGEDVRLSIINKETGKSVLPTEDIDLIDFLLKTRPEGMGRQEFLDREDTWNFSLYTKQDSFIAVMIQINGWTVWSQDDEL